MTSNDTQREKCIIVSKIETITVTKPDSQTVLDLCSSTCFDCGCAFIEKVFPGDLTQIYVKQEIPTDTITFELIKPDGTGVTVIDQTLGEWLDNEYFKADWTLIRNLFGNGLYKIITHFDILNVTNDISSHKFRLSAFDACLADGCVKFEWVQRGSVQDGRVFDPERDYSTRLPGRMVEQTPEEEEETYQTNAREIKSIQKTIKSIYKYKSYLIKYNQKEMIKRNMAIGDEFIVTDFNVNTKTFVNKALYLEKIDEIVDKEGTNDYIITLSFTDLIQDLIKRPC